MNEQTKLAIYYLTQYPIGTKIQVLQDYPWKKPAEVAGVIDREGTPYLKLSDGREVCAERTELIREVEKG